MRRIIYQCAALLWLALLLGSLTACSNLQPEKSAKKNHPSATAEPADNNLTPEARAQLPIIEALQKQLAQDSKNPELHYNLALAHLAYYENADHQLRATREHKAAAIEALREVLRILPGHVPSMKLLYTQVYDGIIQDWPHAFILASDLYKDIPPDARSSLNPPSIAVFIQRYRAQQKAGKANNEELYRALLDAIHEQPNSDKAYLQLAKMYRSQGYYPLALATLKLAEQNTPQSHALYEALAATYEERVNNSDCSYDKTEQLKNAIHYYQKAVPLAPDNTGLHHSLSGLYFDNNLYQLGLYESALTVELDPSAANIARHAQRYSLLGHNQQAQVYLAQAKTKGLELTNVALHEVPMNAGNWQLAALSFTEYLQAQKELRVYDVLKAGIIGAQADLDFSSIIARHKITFHSEWEAAIYAYWTHKMTDAQFKQAARNRCERTEYFFYSGYRAYRAGDINTAKNHFASALKQNTYRFIERPLARQFLHNINTGR